MSVSCICAADSDDILDNQSSSMDLIPLDDDQEMLCSLGSVDNQIHTSSLDADDTSNSSFDESYYASNLNHGSTDYASNSSFDESYYTSNINPRSTNDASNLEFAKTHDEINITSKQNADTKLLINKAENRVDGSINAYSNPQSTNQTTLSDCVYGHHNCNSDNANFENNKETSENKFISNSMNHSYDSYTNNEINFSTYAQCFICINRDWDDNERFYKKDRNSNILTLNFNQVFMAMNLDDNYTPNYQILDDSIHENNLGVDELIIEEDNCTPCNYQLNQFIQLDYGKNITTVNRLENSLTGNSPECVCLDYKTLISPIILSFNFKSGFTFNYMDSCHPNKNMININKNCVKISGVYAEGNKLAIVNNSLKKCIYTSPKFLTQESYAITFNKNIQDYQSKNWNAIKTITPTSIPIFSKHYAKNIESIFNQNAFNVKKCIFKGSHIGLTLTNAHIFSDIYKINTSAGNMGSHNIFNHVNDCTLVGNMNVFNGGVNGR